MIPRPRLLTCDHLLLEDGWHGPAYLAIDAEGRVSALGDGAPPDALAARGIDPLAGFVLPGLPDLHSHAFQRALAGLGERCAPGGEDDFWRWRQAMYAVAGAMGPDELEAVATWLQVELLEGGFTRLGEFHYLHHDPQGIPYAEPAELGLRIAAAARSTGMGLTLLPVLYLHGGFDQPAAPEQRRFVFPDVDAFLGYRQRLAECLRQEPGCVVGVAPHSLRAVDPESLGHLIEGVQGGGALAGAPPPIHLHIAEQPAEVQACVAALGARPVAWLLDQQPVDASWCLVHATWIDEAETGALARSGAVVGLCPTTEASLGDGLFPARRFLDAGGAFGVGTDASVASSAAGELRLLEWGARLASQRRCVLANPARAGGRVGQGLWQAALRGGAQALGVDEGLAVGHSADLIVLDAAHPRLVGHGRESVLEAFVLGGGEAAIAEVVVRGAWVVHEGRHRERERHAATFARAMKRVRAAL